MKRLAVLGVLLATSGVAAAWPWTGRWVSIVEPARVTGLAPLKGPPGTKVVLEGSGFLPGDIVSVGGAPVKAAIQPTRIELTIPKGASSGQVLRLKGRGVKRGGVAGDQLVTVKIVSPPVVDEELEAFLKLWREGHAYDPRKGVVA